MDEIWRDIDGYEGLYQISNKGRVKSLKYGKERILKPILKSLGYYSIILCNYGVMKQFQLHRLVAQAFIPNPNKLPEINHRDENNKNNCVENLEWCNRRYNINYGTRNERVSKKILQYSRSGDFIREWKSAAEVKRVLDINNSNIIQCCKGKRKSSGGFIWIYKEED